MSVSGISVDAARRIDRRIGVPLCLLTTGVLRLWWRLRRKATRPIRRILFIELSEMGSTILANPAMRKAQQSTGAELYFVIFAHNAGSLALTDAIPPRNVFLIDTRSLWRLALDTLSFLIWARQNAIDSVVDLELFSRFTALLTGLCGADRRVGFYRFHNKALYRGEMLTHRVAYNPHIHIAKNFIALIDALLSDTPTIPYSKTLISDDELTIALPPPRVTEREALLMRIKLLFPNLDLARFRIVLINPNASELLPLRRWMPERFAELIRRVLAAYDDVIVLITGAPSERPDAEKMAAECRSDRCVALAGQSALSDLPLLYALADAMVTNDSGPAHFASASGLPTIVLFGPETPDLYKPLGSPTVIYAGLSCSPCVSVSNHRKSACTDNICMKSIGVDEVFSAASAVLTRYSKPLDLSAARKGANTPSLTVAKGGR